MKNSGALFLATTLAILTSAAVFAKVESNFDIARRLMASYHYDEAFPFLQRAAKEDPNNPEIHWALVETINYRESKLRAKTEAEIYLKLAPDGPRAEACRKRVDGWNKSVAKSGEQYALSNLDFWFRNKYKNTPYHSWDEMAEPKWVMDLDKTEHTTKEFKVGVHMIEARLNGPSAPALNKMEHMKACERWKDGLDFSSAFQARWLKAAKQAHASGLAEMYILFSKDGLHATLTKRDGCNCAFETTLNSVLKSFKGDKLVAIPCAEGLIIKAQAKVGEQLKCVTSWRGLWGDEECQPHLATLTGVMEKGAGPATTAFTAITTPLEKKPIPPLPITTNPPASSNADKAVIAQADALTKSGEYKKAIDLLWPLGLKDNVQACARLGRLHNIPGMINNGARVGFVWWQKAACLGDPEAMYQTAFAYEWRNITGHGGKQDAVLWYIHGAQAGSADCMYKLGVLSEFGDGMQCDRATAIDWYKKAAAKGQPDAKIALKRLGVAAK